LFENSEIRTVGDTYYNPTPSGGYILQSRTTSATDKGFVFLNSSLTYGTGPGGNTVANGTNAAAATSLARAAAGAWVDNILFISCKMDTHIASVGWAPTSTGNPAPNPATATATSGWREYGSMDMSGTLLNVSARLANSRQMSSGEIASGYSSRAQIFSAFNSGAGWSPVP
jgi:pectin methylesterase-like acyl-CoA thioesterase